MNPGLTLAELTEHPLRQRLNNEFHARPPVPLAGAMLVWHLVFKDSGANAAAAKENLGKLCQSHVCNAIESSDAHLMIETGAFRMRWELHTEFSCYTFSVRWRKARPCMKMPPPSTQCIPNGSRAFPAS